MRNKNKVSKVHSHPSELECHFDVVDGFWERLRQNQYEANIHSIEYELVRTGNVLSEDERR